jgi:hypothetical protein
LRTEGAGIRAPGTAASAKTATKKASIVAKEDAQLWINHDLSQSDAEKKLPVYYK